MADCQVRRERRLRTFRVRRDPLADYSDAELIERYRLDSAGIQYVTDLLRDSLESHTRRNKALTPEAKVAITLRYLATGKMQLCSADDFGTTQPTISRVITQTLDALTQPQVYTQFVKFPRTAQEIRIKQAQFYQTARFPSVVGAIDATHVRIVAPVENEDVYVNRKHEHSINVQVVCDAKCRLLDVVAKWPGSVHDARILDESGIKVLFERNLVPVQCHLLGDSGYPYKWWLKTPYLRPEPGYQANYNMAHKKTRSVVERAIGQLKRRFHVLHGEVRLSPEKTCKVIYACALLHNLCKDRDIPLPARPRDEDDVEEDVGEVGALQDEIDPHHQPHPARNVGERRNHFAYLHFNNDE